jgi:hypothetical protein
MTSLRAAARQFEITPERNDLTDVRHGGRATELVGGLKTTVFLFEDNGGRLCLVTTHFGASFPINLGEFVRTELAGMLGIETHRVHLFTSHNHTSAALAANGVLAYNAYATAAPAVALLPVGEKWMRQLREAVSELPAKLVPVSVWWTVAQEPRITYDRKGHRDDGTTYLMREEDREKLGDDFRGDTDADAPLLVFRDEAGAHVAALLQFTGHPVTAFHPENTVIFGEWPQVACDMVGEALGAPAGFLQGCAGDVSSKEMFTGGVSRSREFGAMLGQSCLEALASLRRSARDGMDVETRMVGVPLGPLPPRLELEAELAEIENFIRRAEGGDEATLLCVGQNFATGLSPAFRAWLASQFRPWNEWALAQWQAGTAAAVASEQPLEIAAIRLGDVGIVGMPCEPFQNIGRRVRARTTLPLAIPCGYMNTNHGYFPDSENVGGNEYMSAHHRYTKFRAPFRRPAGDVLADAGAALLNHFAQP